MLSSVFGDRRRLRLARRGQLVSQITRRGYLVRSSIQGRIKHALRYRVINVAGKCFTRHGKQQPVDDHADAYEERYEGWRYEWEDVDLIHGHQENNECRAQSDRGRDDAGANPS